MIFVRYTAYHVETDVLAFAETVMVFTADAQPTLVVPYGATSPVRVTLKLLVVVPAVVDAEQ